MGKRIDPRLNGPGGGWFPHLSPSPPGPDPLLTGATLNKSQARRLAQRFQAITERNPAPIIHRLFFWNVRHKKQALEIYATAEYSKPFGGLRRLSQAKVILADQPERILGRSDTFGDADVWKHFEPLAAEGIKLLLPDRALLAKIWPWPALTGPPCDDWCIFLACASKCVPAIHSRWTGDDIEAPTYQIWTLENAVSASVTFLDALTEGAFDAQAIPVEVAPPQSSHVVLLQHLEKLWGAAERLNRHIPEAAAIKGPLQDTDWPWNREKHRADLLARGFSGKDIRAELETGWSAMLWQLADDNRDFWAGLDGAMDTLKSVAPVMDRADLPAGERWTCQLREVLQSISPYGWFRQETPVDNQNMLRAVVKCIQNGTIPMVPELVYRQLEPFIKKLRAVPAELEAPKPGMMTGATIPTLHPDDLKILSVLAEAKSTLTQYDIEEKSNLSRRNVSPRLKRLRQLGYTCRPNGERGGESITAEGRALIAH